MMSRPLLLCAALSVLAASGASAQTAGGSPPAATVGQPLGGPVVPGVCLLSREAVYLNSAIGKATTARLQELARAAQGEIDTARIPLEAEAKGLEGQPDTAPNKQKREALAARWQALQARASQSSREMEATRVKAVERMGVEAQPVVAQVYTQKKCGLLLERGSVLGGNFANDLTADVVRGLDAKIQTITFERERLVQQAPAAPARR